VWTAALTLMVAVAAAVVLKGLAHRRPLAPGAPAPDVEARDQNGKVMRLSDLRGHPVVVYFYPKDRSSGCTLEAQAFRSGYGQFRARGAEIVGVSNDGVASHKDFCGREALPFTLLADPGEDIARAFGVSGLFGYYHRVTFLVDGAGVIRRVFDPVRPRTHAQEVLAALDALPGVATPAPP